MQAEELKRLFPNASPSFLRANDSSLDVGSAVLTLPEGKKPVAVKPAPKRQRKKTQAESEYEAILRRGNPDATVLHEVYTLKLAPDCRYTPDFAVIKACPFSIDFIEVKGRYIFEKALNKPKIAAAMFPYHNFFLATKRLDGSFDVKQLPSE
jgi:hypothetical protein